MPILSFFLAYLLAWSTPVGAPAGHVQYIGGTRADLAGSAGVVDLADDHYFVFYAKKASFRVPYDKINLLEYGQNVNRRIAMAVVISPLFLLSKKRQHFLSIGYQDEQGRQQALVFRVEKASVRTLLVSLEARTGLRVDYQDEEARKGGKG